MPNDDFGEERNAMRAIVCRDSGNDQRLILEKWKVSSRNLCLILNVKTARNDIFVQPEK
jgi:hypothetical protein